MRLLILSIFTLFIGYVNAQNNDPVLFSVDNEDVHLSEFQYIYEKNNADKADYSKESLDEYLELYKKFKLKVKRAKDIGLDTVVALQKELAGYRKQLAKSYLKDKEISDRLITEVAERMQEDVEVAHIFISAPPKSQKTKIDAAEKKINDIHDKINELGTSVFSDLAKTLSEDKASSLRGGTLGFYTSPLPDGFYQFENAMYETKVGEVSPPVRSKMGFHIIHVKKRRPARGQMEIAQILVRINDKSRSNEQSKILVDSIYSLLKEGRNFENMAAKFSDDAKSKTKGGYLGFFGVNQYEMPFENVAFDLKNDNDLSMPVETSLGYHIIKRISKRDNSDKEKLRKRIQARINNNDRFMIAEEKMIADVKKEAGFKEDKMAYKRMATSLEPDFYSYKWQAPDYDEKLNLFTMGGKDYSLKNFAEYAKTNVRERLKFSKKKPLGEAAEELYAKYVKDKVMEYEEANLERKYPDFKSLMREYREGILLFEITKQEVWDKASKDTTGLKSFFSTTDKKYMWPERVKAYKYTVEGAKDQAMISVYKYAQKKNHEKFIEKYNDDDKVNITFKEEVLESGAPEFEGLTIKEGTLSQLSLNPLPATFYRFVEIIKPSEKSLDEAKGYVIADYQDFLENKWIEDLKAKYPIDVKQKVLKKITK